MKTDSSNRIKIEKLKAVAPRMVILLPFAYIIHLGEEWFGGFLSWTQVTLGNEISVERFIIINAMSLVIFVIGTGASLQFTRMCWFPVSMAALLGLNGVIHGLASIGLGTYSPGTVTGLILYVPISVLVLQAMKRRLSEKSFRLSFVLGILFHVFIAILAFV